MKQFNLETQSWEEEEEELTLNSLELLQSVYRDCKVPLTTRMRAAIAALPFEAPKLAVTAYINDSNFAERLERALMRSAKASKVIETTPTRAVFRSTK